MAAREHLRQLVPIARAATRQAGVELESLDAVAATKSTDGVKIADHIRKTKWNTALGPIQFDKKGDVLVSPYVVWEVKNRKFVEVE